MRGTITGKGADYIIVDDPHKPEDVQSPKLRLLDCEWFENTLQSRLDNQNEGRIIVVGQRLHTHDLSGYLIDRGNWNILNIPAINNAPQYFQVRGIDNKKIKIKRKANQVLLPKIASKNSLDKLKLDIGLYNYSAQYLQNPLPEDGIIFKQDWFVEYDKLPDREPSLILQSWDTALKDGMENDYSACCTIYIYEDDTNEFTHHFYVVNVFREKLNFPNLMNKVTELRELHKAQVVVIEDTGAGTSLLQSIKSGCYYNAYKPKVSKKERFTGITGYFADSRIRFMKDSPWLETVKDEIFKFPSGKHDDIVDSISQAIDYFRSHYRPVRVYSF